MSNPRLPIRCLLLDDEPNALEVLRHHLSLFPGYEVVGAFETGIEARQFLKTRQVDLLFLDIQMPGINGLDFLRSLDAPPPVFFTTAYRHYAPEAFELEVLDYLLKPISVDRLRKALIRFERKSQESPKEALSNTGTITIRADRSDVHIPLNHIRYLEAYGDYVKLHLVDKTILTKDRLHLLSARLPAATFRQIHRAYVVNQNFITRESTQFVELRESILPVSRTFRKK